MYENDIFYQLNESERSIWKAINELKETVKEQQKTIRELKKKIQIIDTIIRPIRTKYIRNKPLGYKKK